MNTLPLPHVMNGPSASIFALPFGSWWSFLRIFIDIENRTRTMQFFHPTRFALDPTGRPNLAKAPPPG